MIEFRHVSAALGHAGSKDHEQTLFTLEPRTLLQICSTCGRAHSSGTACDQLIEQSFSGGFAFRSLPLHPHFRPCGCQGQVPCCIARRLKAAVRMPRAATRCRSPTSWPSDLQFMAGQFALAEQANSTSGLLHGIISSIPWYGIVQQSNAVSSGAPRVSGRYTIYAVRET